jgi:hypothetical protein
MIRHLSTPSVKSDINSSRLNKSFIKNCPPKNSGQLISIHDELCEVILEPVDANVRTHRLVALHP